MTYRGDLFKWDTQGGQTQRLKFFFRWLYVLRFSGICNCAAIIVVHSWAKEYLWEERGIALSKHKYISFYALEHLKLNFFYFSFMLCMNLFTSSSFTLQLFSTPIHLRDWNSEMRWFVVLLNWDPVGDKT